MTKIGYFAPMNRVIFLCYPGAEGLDIMGPAAVFSAANDIGSADYETILASSAGGLVNHAAGVELKTCRLDELRFRASDTVLFPGGLAAPVAAACRDESLLTAARNASRVARRIGSICTGVFLLGAAGLLANRQVATHWESLDALARLHPDTQVDGQSLYKVDGRLWTSAGVASGIDMALAMIETDFDRAMRCRVANRLVVHSHREGHQSQFSEVLIAQNQSDGMFGDLIDWLNCRLSEKVTVFDMASYVNMSARTFQRKFTDHLGQPPAKFFERLRLAAARDMLSQSMSVALVCHKVGFASESSFRKTFKKTFGVSPNRLRLSDDRDQ